jgi:hypothetical protein
MHELLTTYYMHSVYTNVYMITRVMINPFPSRMHTKCLTRWCTRFRKAKTFSWRHLVDGAGEAGACCTTCCRDASAHTGQRLLLRYANAKAHAHAIENHVQYWG